MILPRSFIRHSLVCLQIVTALAMAPGELFAIQIEPNPNPTGNTITITPATPAENLVPFSNAGIINIQPAASLYNASRFENDGRLGSDRWVINSGTITNSDVFLNNGLVDLKEGSRFNNLASGTYSGLSGHMGINGTFVNEGAVTHSLGHIIVGETGEYIQRQSLGSSVTPTTITPDAPFTNRGRVHIAAGDFIIDPLRVFAASATYGQSSTGTTQIDARLQNIGGRVQNAGAITVGATGEYRQESPMPGFLPGSTVNTGTFTNAGTTNINTGVFENNGGFRNDAGQVRIGEGASFTNKDTGYYFQPFGGTTKIDGRFTSSGDVVNGGAITVSTTGVYSQVAGISSPSSTFNPGTFTNAGQVRIGEGTAFTNAMLEMHPFPSGLYEQQASGTTQIDGIFVNGARVENAGAVTVGATGTYSQTSNSAGVTPTTVNTGTFTNAGQVRIGEGTFFNNFSSQGSPVGQYLQQTSGTTQIDGTFQNAGARVENAGTMTVGATGAYVQAFNKFVPVVSTTVNTGTFINAGSTLINGGTFTNQGSLMNSGALQVGVVGPGAVINHGGVVNSGTFEVAALGHVSGTGTYVQNTAAAQTIVNGTFAHNVTLQAGTLTGTGTIQGTVQNYGGLLLPGNNGLGTLTIKGQYAQGFGGTFGVNLAGLNSHGLLAVQGTGVAVKLNGFLTIGLLNGFSPSLGSTFGVLTCTGCTMSGTLLGLSLPTLASGLDWSVRVVDALGTLQLAVVTGPAASAPEPATLLLVGSGFVGLAAWRRRQRRAVVRS